MSLIVRPGTKVDLRNYDPGATPGFRGGKKRARSKVATLTARLGELQYLMHAEGKRRVLVILQGMDTSGKDGAIRNVFRGVNPQGVTVVNFKMPTATEAAHDFLWRIHQVVPYLGGPIVVFNRSQAEDYLHPRVRLGLSRGDCRPRLENINAFERILFDEGVTVLKYFLHISKAEQRARLLDRLKERRTQWKFNPKDLEVRAMWGAHMRAYEELLTGTSTTWAPWRVVRADHKWYRDLVIAEDIVAVLEGLRMRFPKPSYDPGAVVID